MDKKLLDYIKLQFAKGFSKEDITNALKKVGYDPNVIEEHFKKLNKNTILKKIFVFGFVILSIVIITFFLYKLKDIMFPNYLVDDSEFTNCYNLLAEEIPKNTDFKQASNYLRQGGLDKALDKLKILAESRPNEDHIHFLLGNTYCKRKNYTLGIESYRKAIILNKNNPFYYLAMARCFERQGIHDKSIELLNKSLYVALDSTNND